MGCGHGLGVMSVFGLLDIFGQIIDGVAGVFEFEIDGFAMMTAMVL